MSAVPRAFPPRPCPVCLAIEPRFLFRQQFSQLSEGSLFSGYDLVCCATCGAAYADGIPPQTAFDRYYAEMSKYENAAGAGESSPAEKGRYRAVADVLERVLDRRARVLDVGCATGGLLAELSRRGFSDVAGLDPSSKCVEIVRGRHGLPATVGTFATLPALSLRADVVLLIGVLEHLRDVDAALDAMKRVLSADGGAIYVEVPDASRYDEQPSAPYQLISYEHINYFSRQSLSRLMVRHGFVEELAELVERPLSPTTAEPALAALFRRRETMVVQSEERDDGTEPALRRYLARSARDEARVRVVIEELVAAQRPLVVWGTGTHTLRLLETTRLKEANLVAFL
ncbi:MAG TPA: class I SAM-dependent methyltransferase, partial [Candidatus Synoicihabitans sp.]|nr:class I SAM-dependent methyltransferase [Candidatus Synoicihabitans sp.]